MSNTANENAITNADGIVTRLAASGEGTIAVGYAVTESVSGETVSVYDPADGLPAAGVVVRSGDEDDEASVLKFPTANREFLVAVDVTAANLAAGDRVAPQSGGLWIADKLGPVEIQQAVATANGATGQCARARYVGNGVLGAHTGIMTDADAAASTGTALKVVADTNGISASLVSTTAGNALTSFTVGSGGPKAIVQDSDSPGGVAVYYDEDATDPTKRLLCVSPSGVDLFVPLTDGSHLRIAHSASAASLGVAVYIDDDAASAHLKLLYVSPTNASGTFKTDAARTWKA